MSGAGRLSFVLDRAVPAHSWKERVFAENRLRQLASQIARILGEPRIDLEFGFPENERAEDFVGTTAQIVLLHNRPEISAPQLKEIAKRMESCRRDLQYWFGLTVSYDLRRADIRMSSEMLAWARAISPLESMGLNGIEVGGRLRVEMTMDCLTRKITDKPKVATRRLHPTVLALPPMDGQTVTIRVHRCELGYGLYLEELTAATPESIGGPEDRCQWYAKVTLGEELDPDRPERHWPITAIRVL